MDQKVSFKKTPFLLGPYKHLFLDSAGFFFPLPFRQRYYKETA